MGRDGSAPERRRHVVAGRGSGTRRPLRDPCRRGADPIGSTAFPDGSTRVTPNSSGLRHLAPIRRDREGFPARTVGSHAPDRTDTPSETAVRRRARRHRRDDRNDLPPEQCSPTTVSEHLFPALDRPRRPREARSRRAPRQSAPARRCGTNEPGVEAPKPEAGRIVGRAVRRAWKASRRRARELVAGTGADARRERLRGTAARGPRCPHHW